MSYVCSLHRIENTSIVISGKQVFTETSLPKTMLSPGAALKWKILTFCFRHYLNVICKGYGHILLPPCLVLPPNLDQPNVTKSRHNRYFSMEIWRCSVSLCVIKQVYIVSGLASCNRSGSIYSSCLGYSPCSGKSPPPIS